MPTGSSTSRVVWDDGAEKHLLMLILLQSKPAVDWNLVALKFGKNVTPGALMYVSLQHALKIQIANTHSRQKYQKIRKRDAAIYGMDDGGDGTTSAASTPKSATKRRRAKEDVTDDEEMEESPTKKARKGGRVPKTKVKKEASEIEYADSEADTVKREVDEFEDEAENGVDGEYEEA
jgi:hypothetical protein